jgi:hypothetical protein
MQDNADTAAIPYPQSDTDFGYVAAAQHTSNNTSSVDLAERFADRRTQHGTVGIPIAPAATHADECCPVT